MTVAVDRFKFRRAVTACPITGERVVEAFTSVEGRLCLGGFRYSYSAAADFYFINPQPAVESLDFFYNGHAPVRTAESLERAFTDYAQKGKRYDYAAAITSHAERFLGPRKSWVDFGCGDGILIFHNQEAYDVAGVEISLLARQFLTAKGLQVYSSLEDFQERKFDLITAIDVIEHMADPKAFLLETLKHLKDDGVILIRLPVIDGIMFERGRPEAWYWVYAPYHLSMFSVRAVKLLAESVNLKCEIRQDEDMHASFFGFCARYGMLGLYSRRGLSWLFSGLYTAIRPLFRRRFVSDCVFVVLSR